MEWRLECWRYALEREMKVSRSKTEYLCINGGNDKKTVNMEGKKVLRVKKFKYLGSTVQESALPRNLGKCFAQGPCLKNPALTKIIKKNCLFTDDLCFL